MKKSLATVVVTATLVSSACLAGAQTDALDITNAQQVNLNANNFTLGWAFSTGSQALDVKSLGWIYEPGQGDHSITVGIWTSGGSLLGTANSNSSNTNLSNWFEFSTDLSNSITLAANTDYVIGATGVDHFANTPAFTTNLGITFLGYVNAPGAPLAFPTQASPSWLEADFQATPQAVPEPTQTAVLGVGALGLVLRKRRIG